MVTLNLDLTPFSDDIENLILDSEFSNIAAAQLLGFIATEYIDKGLPIHPRLSTRISNAFLKVSKIKDEELLPRVIAQELNLQKKKKNRQQSIIRVYEYINRLMAKDQSLSHHQAIIQTAKRFKVSERTIRIYIKDYEDLARVDI